MNWVSWVFSGVGVGIPLAILEGLRERRNRRNRRHAASSLQDTSPPAADDEPSEQQQVATMSDDMVELPKAPLLQSFRPSPFGDVDLVIRVAVQLPGSQQLGLGGRTNPAAQLPIEQREALLFSKLGTSAPNGWLGSRRSWRLTEGGQHWLPTRVSDAEVTNLICEPTTLYPHPLRPPLTLECSVVTGWEGHGKASSLSLRMTLDLSVRLLELDESRGPSPIRHATTPPPAPAAFSVAELHEALVCMLGAADTASLIAEGLLPQGDYRKGVVSMWLVTNGVELGRVIDLTPFSRIRNPAVSNGWEEHGALPLPHTSLALETTVTSLETRCRFVTDFLTNLLEHDGWRQVRPTLEQLMAGP